MRKIFKILLCIAVVLSCFFGCAPTNTNEIKSYKLSYAWILETGEVASIPEKMWKESGKYPKVYQSGKATKIDDLQDIENSEGVFFLFEGWYYDGTYKNRVEEGEIPPTKSGDITLYAKISEREIDDGKITFSISYKWKDNGEWKDIKTLPSAVLQGLVFPAEYEKGVPLSLPILPNWNKNERVGYEFDGWYYDEALENKVRGNTLSQDQTGDLVLYTEFLVWIK